MLAVRMLRKLSDHPLLSEFVKGGKEMAKDNPTFEEVDKLIQKADISALQKAPRAAARAAADPAAVFAQVCAAYKIIRPILALLLNTPLLPKKWKDAIRAFMKVLDAICP